MFLKNKNRKQRNNLREENKAYGEEEKASNRTSNICKIFKKLTKEIKSLPCIIESLSANNSYFLICLKVIILKEIIFLQYKM